MELRTCTADVQVSHHHERLQTGTTTPIDPSHHTVVTSRHLSDRIRRSHMTDAKHRLPRTNRDTSEIFLHTAETTTARPQRLNRNGPQQTTFYNRGQRKQVRFANNWNSDQAFNGLKNRSTRYGESYSNRNHWAQNKTCFQCGKHGHIARYCRSVHVQNPNA